MFFNGSGSRAAAGRHLVSHQWDFGDGASSSGVTASHAYHVEGTYVVTLNVSDDQGQVGTATAPVVVGATGPVAAFVFSPTEPGAGQTVFFDASASDAGPGRTVTGYLWNFGDGSASSAGSKTNHKFTIDGT